MSTQAYNFQEMRTYSGTTYGRDDDSRVESNPEAFARSSSLSPLYTDRRRSITEPTMHQLNNSPTASTVNGRGPPQGNIRNSYAKVVAGVLDQPQKTGLSVQEANSKNEPNTVLHSPSVPASMHPQRAQGLLQYARGTTDALPSEQADLLFNILDSCISKLAAKSGGKRKRRGRRHKYQPGRYDDGHKSPPPNYAPYRRYDRYVHYDEGSRRPRHSSPHIGGRSGSSSYHPRRDRSRSPGHYKPYQDSSSRRGPSDYMSYHARRDRSRSPRPYRPCHVLGRSTSPGYRSSHRSRSRSPVSSPCTHHNCSHKNDHSRNSGVHSDKRHSVPVQTGTGNQDAGSADIVYPLTLSHELPLATSIVNSVPQLQEDERMPPSADEQ
ncbi:hypothetical protein K439DRAFT_1663983 [Ramaria rubella]|nr:hypothetical protein K439DRAFT_1663983 [Ramaria rubella]